MHSHTIVKHTMKKIIPVHNNIKQGRVNLGTHAQPQEVVGGEKDSIPRPGL